MAGVGFALKKLFRDKQGYLGSIKAYAVSAVVTEGPMVLTILMLLMLRGLLGAFGAAYKEEELFLFTFNYILIFSLIFSNTVLMFINRYISDCIYQEEMERILPAFYGVVFFLVLIGGAAAFIYLMMLPVSMMYRVIVLAAFCTMLIIWVQVAFLSAVKQYSKVLIGFFAGVIVTTLTAMILMYAGQDPLMSALTAGAIGFFVMAVMFMQEMLGCYPSGRFNLFQFFPALDEYKILILTGGSMALGLFAHNFVIWTSSYREAVFDRGVFCSRYDVPVFFATLTITPMLVQFVVSLEVNFYEKYREYFDAVLYGGTLKDIQAARKSMTRVLFREIAEMMEIQLFVTIICAVFLGAALGKIGFTEEMTGIFRTLCFGYCMYGLAKSLIILLLYFDDREGACISAVLFLTSSAVLTAVTLKLGNSFWGAGFFAGAVCTVIYTLRRLLKDLKRLEYLVFCKQPLFSQPAKGIFTRIEEVANQQSGKES